MKWLLALISCIAIGIASSSAAAQNEEGPPAPEAKKLVLDGEEGVWLPLTMAQDALADGKKIPELEAIIVELQKKIDTRGERIEACKEAVGYEERAVDKAMEAVAAAEQRAMLAEERLEVWYRHPGVLIGVGVVVTVVLEVVVIQVLKSVGDG